MQQIIWIIASFSGAMGTYLLHRMGLNVVVSSCIIGLVGFGFSLLFKMPSLAYVIFAGSFVGMTSPKVGNYYFIALASVTCGFIYGKTLNWFTGFGGKLGATAFVSTCITFIGMKLVKKISGR